MSITSKIKKIQQLNQVVNFFVTYLIQNPFTNTVTICINVTQHIGGTPTYIVNKNMKSIPNIQGKIMIIKKMVKKTFFIGVGYYVGDK